MKINTPKLLARIELYSFQYFIYPMIITNFLINLRFCSSCSKCKNQLHHKRLCLKNNILHLKLYYELKLYEIRVCWLYEGTWKSFVHVCIYILIYGLLRIILHTWNSNHSFITFLLTTQMNKKLYCVKIQSKFFKKNM
jgi:hypothetical protein